MYRSFRLTYRSQFSKGNSGLICWEGRNLLKKSEAPGVRVLFNNNNNNRRLVTLAEHTSDHAKQIHVV